MTPDFCFSLATHERTSFMCILPSFTFPISNPTSTGRRNGVFRAIHIPSIFIPHQNINIIAISDWNHTLNRFCVHFANFLVHVTQSCVHECHLFYEFDEMSPYSFSYFNDSFPYLLYARGEFFQGILFVQTLLNFIFLLRCLVIAHPRVTSGKTTNELIIQSRYLPMWVKKREIIMRMGLFSLCVRAVPRRRRRLPRRSRCDSRGHHTQDDVFVLRLFLRAEDYSRRLSRFESTFPPVSQSFSI